jgi:hypothetical protein
MEVGIPAAAVVLPIANTALSTLSKSALETLKVFSQPFCFSMLPSLDVKITTPEVQAGTQIIIKTMDKAKNFHHKYVHSIYRMELESIRICCGNCAR